MDQRSRGHCVDYTNGFGFCNQRGPILAADPYGNNPFVGNHHHFVDRGSRGKIQCHNNPSGLAPWESSNIGSSSSSVSPEEDTQDDCDFSDGILKYISHILMEEDMEDKACMLHESLDLQAAERSFYEVLAKRYPPSPGQNGFYLDQNRECPDDHFPGNYSSIATRSSDSSNHLVHPTYSARFSEPTVQGFHVRGTSQSSAGSSYSGINIVDGFLESPVSTLHLPDDLFGNNGLALQFRKGVEEASKFLPSNEKFYDNLRVNEFSYPEKESMVAVKAEKEEAVDFSTNGSRVRKSFYNDDVDLEEENGRNSKQAAVFSDSIVRTDEFDMVLLCKGFGPPPGCRQGLDARDSLQNEGSRDLELILPKVSKSRNKKEVYKKEMVDLRTLLIHCAQSVAADDRKTSNELLRQIRQHACSYGDGNQRLAHCFADGLEARLAGTGSQIYKSFINKRASAADMLKAYHLYCKVCPFRKVSHFFSNRTIINAAKNSARVHIIDFGILYGFQWPTFLLRLQDIPGGPPKIRMTMIDFPQPGFRPAERVEETGRRLKNYAEEFNVPFEYNAIAKQWETITVEELKIDRDELLIVNCLYRFKNLHDESVAVNSARNIVLNLVKEINPDIFIHGIVNGVFNAPFFVTRFREVLFHFSALFDMLEMNVPRDNRERMLIEGGIFGKEALNVIACEGWERVERPESYKQWTIRNLRAGFVQLPLNKEIILRARERVKRCYHKEFVIDEDSQWLLFGWKGRIIHAISSWRPI